MWLTAPRSHPNQRADTVPRNRDEIVMGNRLYVGNLAYSTMDQQLHEAFSEFGEVTSASVVIDRATGQSRGFGFVEYGTNEEAERAIQSLNGATLDGRSITVNVARERRPPRDGRVVAHGDSIVGAEFDEPRASGVRPAGAAAVAVAAAVVDVGSAAMAGDVPLARRVGVAVAAVAAVDNRVISVGVALART